VRLGARLVYDEDELPIAAIESRPGESETPEYLARPQKTEPKADKEQEKDEEEEEPQPPKVKKSEEKPAARVSERDLHPKNHELAVKVIIPNDLACTLVEYPDVAWALKSDLARALALRADRAFLHGDGQVEPLGITNTSLVSPAGAAAGLLELVRLMVRTVRRRGVDGRFGCAGWILHPNTLDALSGILSSDGLATRPPGPPGVPGPPGAWTLDAVTLLAHDGRDGGVLVGYPFVVTPAAQVGNAPMIHFSSDWTEAWIGAYRRLVTIDVSADVQFQTDETVIRAVMKHDFVVRRPSYFVYAEALDAPEPQNPAQEEGD
jgi:hypothetical protein